MSDRKLIDSMAHILLGTAWQAEKAMRWGFADREVILAVAEAYEELIAWRHRRAWRAAVEQIVDQIDFVESYARN